MEENDILMEKQSGFRKGHSTVSAVADLTDTFFKAINRREITLAAFIDKAFNTVDHQILGNKLEMYGVRGESS